MVLEELLRYREATAKDTAWFRDQKHDRDLCPAVEGRLNDILDFFLKYQAINNNIQGLRDHGADVVLRYSLVPDSDDERVVVVQVKSFDDIKRGGILKELKAQFFDTRDRYGSKLERYFVLVCTDEIEHHIQVRDIAAVFSNESLIRVIGPKFARTFLEMKLQIVSATVDRFLKDEDYVHKEAKNEISDLSPLQFAIVLDALMSVREGEMSPERMAFGQEKRILEVAKTYLGLNAKDIDLPSICGQLEDSVFTRKGAYSDHVALRLDNFPAIRCLLLDANIRFEYSGDELYYYMYESLYRSAVGDEN